MTCSWGGSRLPLSHMVREGNNVGQQALFSRFALELKSWRLGRLRGYLFFSPLSFSQKNRGHIFQPLCVVSHSNSKFKYPEMKAVHLLACVCDLIVCHLNCIKIVHGRRCTRSEDRS